jgi:hypothetical protein
MDVGIKHQESASLALKLRLPLQAAPINRLMIGGPAILGDGGLQPSDWKSAAKAIATGIVEGAAKVATEAVLTAIILL